MTKKPAHSKELEEHFKDIHTRAERDSAIISAVEDGYTQAKIAKHLKMSRSNVCKIVKSVYSTPHSREGLVQSMKELNPKRKKRKK